MKKKKLKIYRVIALTFIFLFSAWVMGGLSTGGIH